MDLNNSTRDIYIIYREDSVCRNAHSCLQMELLRIHEMLKIMLTKISLFLCFSAISVIFLFATLLVYIIPRLQSQKDWTNIKSNSLKLCCFSSSITQLMGFHSVFVYISTAVCQLSMFNCCLNSSYDHPSTFRSPSMT